MDADAVRGCDVVVIGAGVAGLAAAGAVVRSGRSVVVLEKSRGVGGRMATRRVGEAVCDHGAQFFTVRGRAFGGIVADAHDAGAVRKWCDGFAHARSVEDEPAAAADGHPRWCGDRGMTDLPKRLAAELPPERCEVRCGARAASIGVDGGRVRIVLDRAAAASPAGDAPDRPGDVLAPAGAIVTCPVPQALDLLAAGGLMAAGGGIDPDALRLLSSVDYDPCFALMVVLDRPSRVPPPGAIRFDAGPVAWLADNRQKGISAVPSLTVHASAAFSREHFESPPDRVADMLLAAVARWIDGPAGDGVVDRSLQRWRYSQPTTILSAPLVAATSRPPIVCCGDAFAGPRVEGAASSGLAAGRWMARVLDAAAAP